MLQGSSDMPSVREVVPHRDGPCLCPPDCRRWPLELQSVVAAVVMEAALQQHCPAGKCWRDIADSDVARVVRQYADWTYLPLCFCSKLEAKFGVFANRTSVNGRPGCRKGCTSSIDPKANEKDECCRSCATTVIQLQHRCSQARSTTAVAYLTACSIVTIAKLYQGRCYPSCCCK